MKRLKMHTIRKAMMIRKCGMANSSMVTASFAAPKSWDAWVEYLNAEEGAFLDGSTNMWRFCDMDNVKSWGVGVDYTFAKNAMFSVMQSFASEGKMTMVKTIRKK
jgi:hypothetical protein